MTGYDQQAYLLSTSLKDTNVEPRSGGGDGGDRSLCKQQAVTLVVSSPPFSQGGMSQSWSQVHMCLDGVHLAHLAEDDNMEQEREKRSQPRGHGSVPSRRLQDINKGWL
ncbi:hypothetical protein NHX12_009033 [Muraenolepis orangiensis]|uniref:Uncharacterized protein n=1 Tax=Muraenolepis orangiensis TaxID=630683 RepID=A0A9Q0IBT3_9TELE|nr:hypothetical protein NHX12_009033 [Muraenolepis orangiensis]